MPLRIFITGASGFVGAAIIEELLARGHQLNALTHHHPIDAPPGAVNSIAGDLDNPATLDNAMQGCDAAIHLVGIIAEKPAKGITFQRMHVDATRAIVQAAQRNAVQRYLHMSALGTRAGAVSAYHQTKYQAEQIVGGSALQWTIFRPSLIHGPLGQFMQMVAQWARRDAAPYLFMPYFGRGLLGLGGAGLLQPVYVKDVARAFADALEKPQTIEQAYDIAGDEQLTWPEFYRIAAIAIIGKKRLTIPIPAWYAKLLTHILPASIVPFNRDQVIMSQEDNTCDLQKFEADFGWRPAGFSKAIEEYDL